jgi:hypothetical protein
VNVVASKDDGAYPMNVNASTASARNCCGIVVLIPAQVVKAVLLS